MDIVDVFGVKIHNTSLDDVTDQVDEFLKGDTLKVIYTPNTEIVMAAKDDRNLMELINRGDLILPDGIGLIYGSRIQKRPLKERVTGFDISMKMLEIANKNRYSLYLLGGKDGVARDAAKRIEERYSNIRIAGFHHGFFKGSHIGLVGEREEQDIVDEINRVNPDIIFVGLGFPRQEMWIDGNRHRLKGRVIIGNGGVMDILSGNAKRAPEIYQKLGLEWLYRLIKEPSRFKRQLVLPKFMLYVLFNKDVIK